MRRLGLLAPLHPTRPLTRGPLLALLLASALALGLLLAPAGGAATAAGRPADGAGNPAGAVYMQGRDLHLRDGSVLRLDVGPGQGESTILLGRTPRGWAVATYSDLYLLSAEGTTRLGPRSTDLENTTLLGRDRRHVVHGYSDQADGFSLEVTDLDGDRVLSRYVTDGTPTAADRSRVYLTGDRGLRTVDLATGRVERLVRKGAGLVDLARDVVFVRTTRYGSEIGPTSLSDPGERTWTARTEPLVISPDGRLLLSADGTVRRMRDGHLVRDLPVPRRRIYTQNLGWAGNGAVLAVVDAGPDRQAMVRCAVAGGPCRRVGPAGTGSITFPTQVSGSNRQP
ncbi:hypothetical protein [Nocardioides nanhaiensis]|uniref:WD40 repeat domain-containing protein n=1 Tax=Nocardioides nanhaiensis TaxID=1476871 RepID=A0ABP8WPP9_9ACTN